MLCISALMLLNVLMGSGRGGESMGPVGAVAPTGIFGIFFYIKVLEVLTIVAPTENPKKKLQLKVLNPIHIPIRDCPH